MISRRQITALPYYGGKQRLAGWIRDQLPYTREYMEPFGGMASVLLARAPVRYELLNDQSQIVADWWRVIRDSPDELRRKIEATPSSRAIHADARAILGQTPASAPILLRAWAFHVIALQTMAGNYARPSWRPTGTGNSSYTAKRDRIQWDALHLRIRDVELECCDAVDIIERTAHRTEMTVYADPPYRHAHTRGYLAQVDDHARLGAALLAHQGNVAVSGYPDDWPELDAAGWRRATTPATVTAGPAARPARSDRTECLWANYDPPGALLL